MVDKKKFEEEEAMGYNISIIGRHVQITEAMKKYAWDKLAKIERFHNHIMDVHVTMDINKIEHSVVIIVKFDHFKVKSQAVTTDMYASIDQAIDRLQRQFRRWKDKIQDHAKKKLSIVDIEVNLHRRPDELDEFNKEMEADVKQKTVQQMLPGKVIGNKTIPLKMLTTEEAIMKMELSGDHFMVYRQEEDQKLKVIYRRDDGNYGIIRPE